MLKRAKRLLNTKVPLFILKEDKDLFLKSYHEQFEKLEKRATTEELRALFQLPNTKEYLEKLEIAKNHEDRTVLRIVGFVICLFIISYLLILFRPL